MTWWQSLLIAVAGAAVTAFLAFVFSRNEKTSKLAHMVLTSQTENMRLVERMRTAMYAQSERLNAWENWGLESAQVWRQWRTYLLNHDDCPDLPQMPKPPEGHLDLSSLFSDRDYQDMSEMGGTEKQDRAFKFNNLGSF